MSQIDDVVQNNRHYALTFSHRFLSSEPRRKLVIIACMDVRHNVHDVLGLRVGDAHVLRNAGAIVTEDILRSLAISVNLKGAREIMVMGHSDCGMSHQTDAQIKALVERSTGKSGAPDHYSAFTKVEESIRAQIKKLRASAVLPDDILIRGFVYHVETGLLEEVKENNGETAAR